MAARFQQAAQNLGAEPPLSFQWPPILAETVAPIPARIEGQKLFFFIFFFHNERESQKKRLACPKVRARSRPMLQLLNLNMMKSSLKLDHL